jgi:hypothetical protein
MNSKIIFKLGDFRNVDNTRIVVRDEDSLYKVILYSKGTSIGFGIFYSYSAKEACLFAQEAIKQC